MSIKCPICGFKAKTEGGLKTHMRARHPVNPAGEMGVSVDGDTTQADVGPSEPPQPAGPTLDQVLVEMMQTLEYMKGRVEAQERRMALCDDGFCGSGGRGHGCLGFRVDWLGVAALGWLPGISAAYS